MRLKWWSQTLDLMLEVWRLTDLLSFFQGHILFFDTLHASLVELQFNFNRPESLNLSALSPWASSQMDCY